MQNTFVEMRYCVFSQSFIRLRTHASKDLFRDFLVYWYYFCQLKASFSSWSVGKIFLPLFPPLMKSSPNPTLHPNIRIVFLNQNILVSVSALLFSQILDKMQNHFLLIVPPVWQIFHMRIGEESSSPVIAQSEQVGGHFLRWHGFVQQLLLRLQ